MVELFFEISVKFSFNNFKFNSPLFSKTGIFVEFNEQLIQGMIPLESLKNHEYYFDEVKMKVLAKENKQ